jgi:hypothetical protein
MMSTVPARCAPVADAAPGWNFYVALNGNDAWSGVLPAPNAAKTDGPFATLERARDEIRARRKAQVEKEKEVWEGATVWVRGGQYFLRQTFRLDTPDSGLPNARIVYRNYPQEKPILIGGLPIRGWSTHDANIWKADVAAQGFKDIYFRQLIADGQRQILARYPNFDANNPYGGGWAYADGKVVPTYVAIPGEDKRTLQLKEKDLRPWARPTDGEVFVYPRYNWWNSILPIASLDTQTRIVKTARDAVYEIRPGDRFYIRNLREELDAPGEWYLDRDTGVLYFWPPKDKPNWQQNVYAPTVPNVVRNESASYVTLQGLTLEGCEGSGVRVNNATGFQVVGCTIRNVGGRDNSQDAGIEIINGTNNGVIGNDIYEVGSHGVSLDGGERTTLTTGGNFADNNYIHHTGVFFKQGVGVSLTGVGNRASHNLIHDCPRFGIFFNGNDQIIEYNHIRHVCLETADTGAIYTLGRDWITSRGSIIRYNFIHDVLGYGLDKDHWTSPHFAWGIYLDDNAAGIDVIGNVVARAIRGLVHLHNARDIIIENNIFVDGTMQQIEMNGWDQATFIGAHMPTMMQGYQEYSPLPAWAKYRHFLDAPPDQSVPMANNVIRRNIFWYQKPDSKLFFHNHLPIKHFESDFNLVHHPDGPVLTGFYDVAPDKHWEEWRKSGLDTHSVLADPKFVNAARDDFRLRPDSPALKLGFVPIPIEKIGPYQSTQRASWPIQEASGAREKPFVYVPAP